MTFLYRIIVTIAALLTIVIGGSWLGNEYDLGPDTGWWKPLTYASYYQGNREDDGVPATDSGNVSVPISPMFGRNSWALDNDKTQVLPVIYGDRGFFGFNQFGYGSNGSSQSGGHCFENVVNLLIINETHPEGAPVFESRVLLARYFYFTDGEEQSVAALVISDDTNEDGRLDCGDEAAFELRSLNDDDIRRADRGFIPDNISQITYSDRENAFTFAEVEYENDQVVSMKNITISRDDLAISETVAPDLISKANAAFANTSKN